MDISSLSAALGSLKAAKDIAEAMVGLRDAAAFQDKRLEFQSRILDAQNSVFAANEERAALVETVRQLKEEVARLKAWDAEEERYELKVIPGFHKALAYALKPAMQGTEPPHWLCACCFKNRKISILQPETHSPGGASVLLCHECGADLLINGARITGAAPEMAGHRSNRRRA
jgi:hypothetical protein